MASIVVNSSIRATITHGPTITDKLELRQYDITKLNPEWTLIQTQMVEMKTFKKPTNLQAIIHEQGFNTHTSQEQVKIDSKPFAEGADRIVFHGVLLSPPGPQPEAAPQDKRLMKSEWGTHIVLKQFKHIVHDTDAEAFFYDEQAQLQATAAFFAHGFSFLKTLHPPIQLRYVQSKICSTKDGTLYSVEPEFQEGKNYPFHAIV